MEEEDKSGGQTSNSKKLSLGQMSKAKKVLLEEENHCQTSKATIETTMDLEDTNRLNEEDEVYSVVSANHSQVSQTSNGNMLVIEKAKENGQMSMPYWKPN